MPDFDVEAFVAKLESLGVKLTAVPLADGRMRINRWRMPHAVDAIQIESLSVGAQVQSHIPIVSIAYLNQTDGCERAAST
jgi:hypothetical protein